MLIDPSGMETVVFPEDPQPDSDMEVESEGVQEVQQEESGQPVQPDGSTEDKPQTNWDKVNTGASAIGAANGIKVGLIQWAIKDAPGGPVIELKNYLKWFKGLGWICGGVNIAYSATNMIDYIASVGRDVQVIGKYLGEIVLNGSLLFLSGESAVFVTGLGVGYFMFDYVHKKLINR